MFVPRLQGALVLHSVTPTRLFIAAALSVSAASTFSACEAARTTAVAEMPAKSASFQLIQAVTRAEDYTAEPMYAAGTSVPLWIDDFDGDTTHVNDTSVGGAPGPLGSYVTLNAGSIHLEPGAGLGATTAVRYDWVRSTACTDDSRLIERTFPPTAELYVQFSVRYTPGFVFDWRGYSPCVGNAKKIFFLWATSGSRFDVISENHAVGVGSDNDHPLFAQLGGAVTPEQLADGAWHRFTFHVRQSSTPTARDGFVQGWIDGRLKWSRMAIATNNGGGYYDFKLPTTFNQGSPVTQSEWLDNLKLWR
jgi:hypothetical protein